MDYFSDVITFFTEFTNRHVNKELKDADILIHSASNVWTNEQQRDTWLAEYAQDARHQRWISLGLSLGGYVGIVRLVTPKPQPLAPWYRWTVLVGTLSLLSFSAAFSALSATNEHRQIIYRTLWDKVHLPAKKESGCPASLD